MKKITLTLLAASFLCGSVIGQRISTMTIAGQTSLVPFAAFNPTNNSETAGDGQIVYPATADLSNVGVTLNFGTEATLDAPVTLPTDWTSTVTGIKLTSTVSPFNWAKYNITVKKIIPATLPLQIKTGTGNFDSNSWTNQTVGWAGACISVGQTNIQFGSANRSFVVAFTDSPDELIYTIKALNWTTSVNVFDVEGSADGVKWETIVKYDGTTTIEATTAAKIKLDPAIRYIRWIYSARGAKVNVSLENITVTKSTASSTFTPEELLVKVFVRPESNEIQLNGSDLVSDISLYDLTGNLLFSQKNPGASVSIPTLRAGIYVSKLTLTSGKNFSTKIAKK